MKSFFWLLPWVVLALSCSVEEPASTTEYDAPGRIFARIESVTEPDTKVYADENLNVRWNKDDRISLFNKTTDNIQYKFLGDDGAFEGEFEPVASQNRLKGNTLDYAYSIYPYQEATTVNEGAITLELPAEQTYAKDSFGLGANTMVSVSEDTDNLVFKNLCGYVILKLYGDDVSVKSIKLEGKNSEPLAGTAIISAPFGEIPSISSFNEGFSSAITLTCTDAVKIGSTAEAPTVFWLAVPPTTFTNGFTVTVTDSEGNTFSKSASSKFTIERNTTFRMKPLRVDPVKTYLVTNQYVQKYMEEVTYTDMDFTNSVLHGSPRTGGGPSNNNEELPPTVPIHWTQSSSPLIVDLYRDGVLDRTYTLNGGSSMDLANLVPGCHYTYKVYRKSDNEIKGQGGFFTKGALHQVFFEEDVRNGRDLGGWKTLEGKTVQYGKLYRGGQIGSSYMSNTGMQEMLAEGIKAELDLRESPSRSLTGEGTDFLGQGFRRGYVDGMLDKEQGGNPEGVKKCFEFTVRCLRASMPVYFHCASGRDRTGTMAILFLGLLGVREGDIAKDYELTYFSPQEWSMEEKSDGTYFYNHTRDVSTYVATVEYLAAFDNTSFKAGVEKYLLSIGVSQDDIDSFRNLMLK